jgi:hypothetical protein
MRTLALALALAFGAACFAVVPAQASIGKGALHEKRVERVQRKALRLKSKYEAGKIKDRRALRKGTRLARRAQRLGLPIPPEYKGLLKG